MTELQSKWYQVNSISLHVWEAGPQHGPVLLLLHGFPEAGFAWEKQIRFFAAKGYRVLAPDQRGYNKSSRPRQVGAYRMELLVGDMVALIQLVTDKKVAVAGHDWGGGVAWHLALAHPHLLCCLIILNMPHPQVLTKTLKHNNKQRFKSSYAGFFQLPFLPELFNKVFNFKLLERTLQRTSRKGTFSDAQIARYKRAWQQPGTLHGMINWYRAYRFSAPLETTQVLTPVLIIWGKKDAFLLPQMAEASAAQCTDVQVIMLEEATHWLHHEFAGEINDWMQSFLAQKC